MAEVSKTIFIYSNLYLNKVSTDPLPFLHQVSHAVIKQAEELKRKPQEKASGHHLLIGGILGI